MFTVGGKKNNIWHFYTYTYALPKFFIKDQKTIRLTNNYPFFSFHKSINSDPYTFDDDDEEAGDPCRTLSSTPFRSRLENSSSRYGEF